MDEIQKEMRVRRRLSTLFNKTREEFSSKEEYDAYLEMFEDYVFNLANNVDVAQTEEKLKEFERANRQSILANQARQAEAQRRPTPPPTANVPKAVPDGPASYMPAMTAPVGNIQPRPVEPAQMDSTGSLVARNGPPTSAPVARAAAAGGWNPDIAKKRLLHDAMSSVFAF